MQISIANNETRQLLNHRIEQLNMDGFKSVLLAHFGDLNQDLINSLTINVEVLNNGLISTKGGAGLGFITMRMKSKDRLLYTFDTCDDGQLFFSISTDLDRTA